MATNEPPAGGPEAPLLPGAWIGVVGGGQLGRMLTMEARRMGYRVCVLDPDPASPTGQLADDRIVAAYTDADAARELAERTDVVTYEFENVDADAVAAAESAGTVRPSSRVLRIAQHRLRERVALSDHGFPVAAFVPLREEAELEQGLRLTRAPAVMKTVTSGYDGKGQAVVKNLAEAKAAFRLLRPLSEALLLEEFIPFTTEVSAIAARDAVGRVVCFPPSENIHVNGILDVSIVPARVPPEVSEAAVQLASEIAEKLDVVGLIAVEMFLTGGGQLLVNEVAPRPHNSGHYTLDACATSQYEQLVRALCNLPLGSVDLLSPVAMVNLLGDVWIETGGRPHFDRALSAPGVRLHLYGKAEARAGRKMGHLTAVAPDVETALARALEARDLAAGRR
ncbi:MAG: 5-(carboxyamino)imidazole ribonucleotide synthase [Dehalococcoidia bacterium]